MGSWHEDARVFLCIGAWFQDSWSAQFIDLRQQEDLLVLFPNYPPYLRRLLHHVVLSFRDVRKVSGPPKKSFRQECCLNIVRH
ncbi:hypothetical protein V6N13_007663 [Hibiscus sabdariffa]